MHPLQTVHALNTAYRTSNCTSATERPARFSPVTEPMAPDTTTSCSSGARRSEICAQAGNCNHDFMF